MELLILRSYFPSGTCGLLLDAKGHHICNTIELPWKENKKRVSCIPEGRYAVRLRYSQRFGRHLILQDVKDRDLILVHPANDAMRELRGCIAPVTTLTGMGKGSGSVKAMRKLMAIVLPVIEKEPVFITIKSDHHDD